MLKYLKTLTTSIVTAVALFTSGCKTTTTIDNKISDIPNSEIFVPRSHSTSYINGRVYYSSEPSYTAVKTEPIQTSKYDNIKVSETPKKSASEIMKELLEEKIVNDEKRKVQKEDLEKRLDENRRVMEIKFAQREKIRKDLLAKIDARRISQKQKNNESLLQEPNPVNAQIPDSKEVPIYELEKANESKDLAQLLELGKIKSYDEALELLKKPKESQKSARQILDDLKKSEEHDEPEDLAQLLEHGKIKSYDEVNKLLRKPEVPQKSAKQILAEILKKRKEQGEQEYDTQFELDFNNNNNKSGGFREKRDEKGKKEENIDDIIQRKIEDSRKLLLPFKKRTPADIVQERVYSSLADLLDTLRTDPLYANSESAKKTIEDDFRTRLFYYADEIIKIIQKETDRLGNVTNHGMTLAKWTQEELTTYARGLINNESRYVGVKVLHDGTIKEKPITSLNYIFSRSIDGRDVEIESLRKENK